MSRSIRPGVPRARSSAADLVAGKHHRQALRRLGARDAVQPGQLDAEHLLVEEEERALRLILGGRRNPAFDGQMREERLDLRGAHLGRMASPVEDDEAPHPVGVCFLGPDAVVLEADLLAQAVEKPGWPIGHGRLLRGAFARPS
jgi:hypothetical protein